MKVGLSCLLSKNDISFIYKLSKQCGIPIVNITGESYPLKKYNYISFQTTSVYTPWEWMKFFDKFSGLVLLTIQYNPTNDVGNLEKWTYEGRIYAK